MPLEIALLYLGGDSSFAKSRLCKELLWQVQLKGEEAASRAVLGRRVDLQKQVESSLFQ